MASTRGSGYDLLVAGPDEVQARSMLAAMQERLLRGPYEALGVNGTATPSDVRAAFLALTKVFHPVRFGRMDQEVQKIANEVFLGLRSAHEALAKPSTKVVRQSQSMPVYQPRQVTQPIATRQSTSQVPTIRLGPPPASNGGQPTRASGSVPAQRSAATPAQSPRPAEGAQRPSRMPTPSPPPGAGSERSVPTARPATTARPASATPPSGHPKLQVTAEERDLAAALELLARLQWDAARTALNTLATKHPGTPRYRALLAFARGREAQLARRIDEARVELEQALQIDPDLQLAKSALGELFTRRK
jgi:hypothetical protein